VKWGERKEDEFPCIKYKGKDLKRNNRVALLDSLPVPSVVICLCSVVGTNIKRSIKGKIATCIVEFEENGWSRAYSVIYKCKTHMLII